MRCGPPTVAVVSTIVGLFLSLPAVSRSVSWKSTVNGSGIGRGALTVCLAVAPTKHADRIEWLAEKATEIGLDRVQWLDCAFSERRNLKLERLERIVVSAMKQSHKAILPAMGEMMKMKQFLTLPFDGDKFIAHCYAQSDIGETEEKPHLFDVVRADRPTLVLIGPEGDFSAKKCVLHRLPVSEASHWVKVVCAQKRLPWWRCS